jgi:prophage maintenance system killer protein
MSRDQNIGLAKRNIVDIIWKEANLEGIAVTYPDTQEIFDGRTVAGLSISETKAVNNLKHAWEFVLDNLDVEIDIRLLRHLNGLVGAEGVILNAGELRIIDVSMGGTDWRPAIPSLDIVDESIRQALRKTTVIEQALSLFCEICRGQWFFDGNKRTAQLAANLLLIRNGEGILSINQKTDNEFRQELIAFYETGDDSSLMHFLYNNAIDGTNFN